ncbi:hypothetical protein QAD02_006171 [Eretmocerus hayati]|uniref:Uncharacterized protein n=1 Tax=Eretmocerus hayati TaxID=131215 RepID=A0ACC2N081_9HYME|nr:hypothetical protein QAD02_006171 [Eretmocerus hayati]
MFEVLMSRRTKKAYDAVFKHIKSVCGFDELKVAMCDFEQPMRSAFAVYWPNVSVVGCNVHFDRAIYRKLKDLKINMSNGDVKKYIGRILALAFLPADIIEDTYYSIKEEMPTSIRLILDELCKYFEKFWIKIVTPGGFSIFGLFQRSNNISEQLNSKYLQYMGRAPSPCKFSNSPNGGSSSEEEENGSEKEDGSEEGLDLEHYTREESTDSVENSADEEDDEDGIQNNGLQSVQEPNSEGDMLVEVEIHDVAEDCDYLNDVHDTTMEALNVNNKKLDKPLDRALPRSWGGGKNLQMQSSMKSIRTSPVLNILKMISQLK